MKISAIQIKVAKHIIKVTKQKPNRINCFRNENIIYCLRYRNKRTFFISFRVTETRYCGFDAALKHSVKAPRNGCNEVNFESKTT